MKSFILILLTAVTFTALGQQDQKAKAILDKFSGQVNK